MMETQRGERTCQRMDCENTASHRCAGCKEAWYCSPKCQKDDWMFHIFDCKPNASIRTAHHLARACRRDLLPADSQTLEDYGFNRVNDSRGMSMLFGLYQGLFMQHEYALEPRTLDKWLKEGTLVDHIKETFERIPESHRGGYYPWFLENQWVLDGSPPPSENTAEALVNRMEQKLWAFLGPMRKAQLDSWSKEQKVCASIYRLLLSDFHPAPFNPSEEYINFGYCVARDMYAELVISRRYKALIDKCTFEEFCDAYESSSLISLMERKDILTSREHLPRHFEHVMRSRHVHESVWDLKQFLYGEGGIRLIPSVLCDYGFMNCKSDGDRKALAAIYKVAFDNKQFDEMELHAHCIKGQILEYIGRFQKLSKKEKKTYGQLMKNPYPLPDMDSLSFVRRSPD